MWHEKLLYLNPNIRTSFLVSFVRETQIDWKRAGNFSNTSMTDVSIVKIIKRSNGPLSQLCILGGIWHFLASRLDSSFIKQWTQDSTFLENYLWWEIIHILASKKRRQQKMHMAGITFPALPDEGMIKHCIAFLSFSFKICLCWQGYQELLQVFFWFIVWEPFLSCSSGFLVPPRV